MFYVECMWRVNMLGNSSNHCTFAWWCYNGFGNGRQIVFHAHSKHRIGRLDALFSFILMKVNRLPDIFDNSLLCTGVSTIALTSSPMEARRRNSSRPNKKQKSAVNLLTPEAKRKQWNHRRTCSADLTLALDS